MMAAAVWGVVVLCAGCQLLTINDSSAPQTAAPAAPSDLERLFSAGRWVEDRTWSALAVTLMSSGDKTAGLSAEPYRYHFEVPDTAKETITDLPTLTARYRWLWATPHDENAAAPSDDEQRKAILVELETAARTSGPAGWTAAILSSRHANESTGSIALHEKLVSLADDKSSPGKSIDVSSQVAAVETWCRALAKLDSDVETNFHDAGRLLEGTNIAEEVRAELYRGIARRIAPKQIPGLTDVMVRHESARQLNLLHRAAVEACVLHAWHQREEASAKPAAYAADRWPEGLRACRYADDATLRKLFARWAALAWHPDALAVIKSHRLDLDLAVREAAVLSLGVMDWTLAREELLAVMAKGTEPERSAAIIGLARGGSGEIMRFVRDDSAGVRAAVATELGRFPSRSAGITLAELLGDRSPEVQLAALRSCRQPGWNEQGRVPLILQALKVGVLRTQIAALAELRQEWGAEPEFPLNGPAEVRDAAVRKLAMEHQVSAEVFTAFASTNRVASAPETAAITVSATKHSEDEIRQLVRQFLTSVEPQGTRSPLVEELARLDPAAVRIIEQELTYAAGPRADDVYRHVLPRLSPSYAAVIALAATEPILRRQAAQELRLAAERGSLSPLLLDRLAGPMLSEQDRQVWQSILTAIHPEAATEAARIALIALNSSWPDLRTLGCGYFERHPLPEYAVWLLPRLQDDDRQVRMKAVQVLGACGNPVALDGYREDETAPGLRSLLTDPDLALRAEVVIAMCRLGDAQAAQELNRQLYDPHPRQREVAVIAMGDSGQRRFLEHLLRRSWTETDRSVQVAILKSLDQLVPLEDRPGLAVDSPISDKIKSWAQWWEQKRNGTEAARDRALEVRREES